MTGRPAGNRRRAWTHLIGYNSGMVTASWIGNWKEGNTSLSGLKIGGKVYPEVDGSLIAAPSWADFMRRIPGLHAGDPFADPTDAILNGANRPKDIDTDTDTDKAAEQSRPRGS